MMEFDTHISGDDFRQALLLHTSFRRSQKTILVFLAVGLFGLALFLYFRRNDGFGILLFTMVFAYIIYHFMLRHVFLPEGSLRAYSQQKGLHAPQKIIFSDEGISISSLYGHSDTPWSHFLKWRENEQYLLIYQTDHQYLILPKRDMNNKRQDLIRLLERKQIPAVEKS